MDRIAGPALRTPCPLRAWSETAVGDNDSNRSDVRERVGSFPGGASPDGVMDLLGCVAEWVDGEAKPGSPGLRALEGGDVWTLAREMTEPPTEVHEQRHTESFGEGGSGEVGFGMRCVATP